jgi:hypothetical protein
MANKNRATNKFCALCPPDKAQRSVHSHHLREVAYGGPEDGPQIGLCANCHNDLHDYARQIVAGTLSLSAITNERWLKALRILLDQRRIFEDAKRSGQLLANRGTVAVQLDRLEQGQLKELTVHYGVSQKDLLKALIQTAYRRMKSGQSI